MRIHVSAHPVCRLFIFLFITGWYGSLSATPQPPPLLCVEDGDCVTTDLDVPVPPGVGYTLASIGSVPFAYSTPIPPIITSEVTVTPATIGANKVNGRRLILSPGNYGNQTFNTQDQEVVFTSGVEFGFLNIAASARRLVFRGSPARAGVVRYITTPWSGGPTDLLFDGITQDHAERQWDMGNYFQGQRIAIINSSLRARNYVIAAFPNTQSAVPTDIVLANNNMETLGSALSGSGDYSAAVRFNPVQRLVFVDNRLHQSGSGYQNFRAHAGAVGFPNSDNIFVARNQFEGTGHAIGASGTGPNATVTRIINVWYEDNVHYKNHFDVPINTGVSQHYVEAFRIRRNQLYGTNSWPTQLLSEWVVQSNTVRPYESPPRWSYK